MDGLRGKTLTVVGVERLFDPVVGSAPLGVVVLVTAVLLVVKLVGLLLGLMLGLLAIDEVGTLGLSQPVDLSTGKASDHLLGEAMVDRLA